MLAAERSLGSPSAVRAFPCLEGVGDVGFGGCLVEAESGEDA